jgi:hypothetical protein
MDGGNSHTHHVVRAFRALKKARQLQEYNLESVSFGDDESVPALQAADMIAWGVRRRLCSGLTKGFEPLAELFHVQHEEQQFSSEYLEEIANSLRDRMKVASQGE